MSISCLDSRAGDAAHVIERYPPMTIRTCRPRAPARRHATVQRDLPAAAEAAPRPLRCSPCWAWRHCRSQPPASASSGSSPHPTSRAPRCASRGFPRTAGSSPTCRAGPTTRIASTSGPGTSRATHATRLVDERRGSRPTARRRRHDGGQQPTRSSAASASARPRSPASSTIVLADSRRLLLPDRRRPIPLRSRRAGGRGAAPDAHAGLRDRSEVLAAWPLRQLRARRRTST